MLEVSNKEWGLKKETKVKVKISQNFVAFSEYMNFKESFDKEEIVDNETTSCDQFSIYFIRIRNIRR